jgi:formamidopyrimidine-DNA glycosylase
MPELPEVETIRRELKPRIINQRITKCTVLREDVIEYPSVRAFCQAIVNETILDVIREAKYLILQLTGNKKLIFHLRLSGTLYLRDRDALAERFTRVIIQLERHQLFFREPRVLGRVYLLHGKDKQDAPKGLYTLGREPLSQTFDYEYLRSKIRGRKAPIKSLLLDQTVCAGVGNIYSDEALFHAGIRPLRRARRITTAETEKLIVALREVLQKAVDSFGTSVGDYTRTDGSNGSFQHFLYVYGREGEPCRVCGTNIMVKKIGNRSTRYCPHCQK